MLQLVSLTGDAYVSICRLGRASAVHPGLHSVCADVLTETRKITSVMDYRILLERVRAALRTIICISEWMSLERNDVVCRLLVPLRCTSPIRPV